MSFGLVISHQPSAIRAVKEAAEAMSYNVSSPDAGPLGNDDFDIDNQRDVHLSVREMRQ